MNQTKIQKINEIYAQSYGGTNKINCRRTQVIVSNSWGLSYQFDKINKVLDVLGDDWTVTAIGKYDIIYSKIR